MKARSGERVEASRGGRTIGEARRAPNGRDWAVPAGDEREIEGGSSAPGALHRERHREGIELRSSVAFI